MISQIRFFFFFFFCLVSYTVVPSVWWALLQYIRPRFSSPSATTTKVPTGPPVFNTKNKTSTYTEHQWHWTKVHIWLFLELAKWWWFLKVGVAFALFDIIIETISMPGFQWRFQEISFRHTLELCFWKLLKIMFSHFGKPRKAQKHVQQLFSYYRARRTVLLLSVCL